MYTNETRREREIERNKWPRWFAKLHRSGLRTPSRPLHQFPAPTNKIALIRRLTTRKAKNQYAYKIRIVCGKSRALFISRAPGTRFLWLCRQSNSTITSNSAPEKKRTKNRTINLKVRDVKSVAEGGKENGSSFLTQGAPEFQRVEKPKSRGKSKRLFGDKNRTDCFNSLKNVKKKPARIGI